ncbi:Mitochondrial import inner membrane translocase subunit TIM14-1 [Linum perenne]
MTKREAALILGVRERTPAKDVKDAYKRIMKVNHPDQGGSHYISNKVNEAKNILLGGKQSSSAF